MAVYTRVADDELREFLAAYDIGALTSFSGIAEGVENSNFLIRTTQGTYILTLYEKRIARRDLPFFLGLMDHLSSRGLSCPTPVPRRDGAVLAELNGKPAAIVTFLEGVWPRRIQPEHCHALGSAVAALHVAGETFGLRRQNALSLSSWRPLLNSCALAGRNGYAPLAAALDAELTWLQQNWPDGLPEGVIHADLFPDNVFYLGADLSGIIDFYFACTDFLAYDLAVCLNAWCFERDDSFNITKSRRMIRAYHDIRPLSDLELEALPVLARGAAIRFLLTRLYDWLNHPAGALVKPKDPMEYQRKLSFHQRVTGPGAYGL